MGKRGPKPKPTALRVFEGDPGRLLNKRAGEVVPPRFGEMAPPDWLGEVGKAVWSEMCPLLDPLGLLTSLDSRLLSLYCEAWEEFFRAREEIAKSGIIAVSEKGGEYQHPAVGIKNRAVQRIKQIGSEFGMSPTARIGMNLGGQANRSALEEFKSHG